MTVWGVTGHMDLGPATRRLVAAELATTLAAETADGEPLVGVSCLAAGADQVFAWVVVALGGELVAVRPCARIEETVAGADLRGMRAAAAMAVGTVALPHDEPSDQAYADANEEVLARADALVAVWDGRPSRGMGGTAETVAAAREQDKRVVVVWPRGARRG